MDLRVFLQPGQQVVEPLLRRGHKAHDGASQRGDRADQLGQHDAAEDEKQQEDQQNRQNQAEQLAFAGPDQRIALFVLLAQQPVKQAHGHAEDESDTPADNERRERRKRCAEPAADLSKVNHAEHQRDGES